MKWEQVIAAQFAPAQKFRSWTTIELALAHAWYKKGVIPKADYELIVAGPRGLGPEFDLDDIERYERESHHDVTAYRRSISDGMGDESRWFGHGATGSDIVDSALALQMATATGLMVSGIEALMGETPLAVTMGPELNYIDANLRSARFAVSWIQLSGPVGTHATLPHEVEEDAVNWVNRCIAGRMGDVMMKVEKVPSQVIGRDRHAHWGMVMARMATLINQLVMGAPYKFAHGRSLVSALVEDVALWHERDISHSSVERIVIPHLATDMGAALDSLRDFVGLAG